MRWLLSILLFTFWGCALSAQPTTAWCGSTLSTIASTPPSTVPTKSRISIPLVVHVLYSNLADSISIAQIESQIAVLNADLKGENADRDDVIFPFRSRRADLEISFELASVGPGGETTTGVLYRQVPTATAQCQEGIGQCFVDGRRAICYDELGGSTAWCTTCYLNIWVVRNSFFAGKAIFPTDIGSSPDQIPADEDGIYINPDRIGTIGQVTAPYDLGRTLTHEIGHYLNLYHLWGPNAPGGEDCSIFTCCDGIYDDLVNDTPEQWRTYLGECPTPGQPQGCDGEFENYQNFMTFADDACLLMFTEGQKERVWNSLSAYRPGLLDANCRQQCINTALVPTVLPFKWHVFTSTLWLENGEQMLDAQLINIQGQLVDSWLLHPYQRQERTYSQIPTGTYLLRLSNGQHIWTKKLIIVH